MKRKDKWIHHAATTVLTICCIAIASAQEPSPIESESKAAWQAAAQAIQRGPQKIALREQAKLNLPEGYGFIPAREGARLMQSMGNQTDARFIGLVIPTSNLQWMMTIDFEPAGYIKDDDAKTWKSDEMLDNIKTGTEEGNKHRESMGLAPMEVTRWIEAPKYDGVVHHLVWSVELRHKNQNDSDPTINYNTYVLGREGYISMDLITSTSMIEDHKHVAATLLAATEFNNGKRYADVNFSTDKIAAYGLAALVGGLAIKKLGLLAIIGAFLLKFAKVIAIGAAAMGSGWFKRFRRNKTTAQTETPATPLPQLAAPTQDKPVADEQSQA